MNVRFVRIMHEITIEIKINKSEGEKNPFNVSIDYSNQSLLFLCVAAQSEANNDDDSSLFFSVPLHRC